MTCVCGGGGVRTSGREKINQKDKEKEEVQNFSVTFFCVFLKINFCFPSPSRVVTSVGAHFDTFYVVFTVHSQTSTILRLDFTVFVSFLQILSQILTVFKFMIMKRLTKLNIFFRETKCFR